ncbi:hypothetical protein JZ751_029881 [Albula glossodonta]|uniref:AP-4 complex subunit epsilon n=1 Tax=Albula glossodonta TaxID=121402 RepID=A0A8T2NH65_9TELE|nr:hypothetical protein JZ751_029881 [Albula glossodonta]
MSDVVEKTLTALPSLLSLDPQPGAGKLSATSKLGNLIRSVTELTSKHEEEKLIKKELTALKEQISSPNTTLRQMREIMVRAIYCEMLGYEASFSYIHAIKLAQQGSGLEKRVGYLAVSLFLNESHDLLLLLVNTVLKDLQSTNLIEVCMALTVVSQVFPKDMIPAVLPLVEDKLTHSKEIIRRKAVLALYKFYLIAPNQVQHIHDKFRKALCDKDPGVMTASLHIYFQMIKENPDSFKELTGSLVAILKQVVGGRLPVEFNYHSTVYTIHPKSELLEKAAKCIGKFVLSPKINLKYLGLKALTYVIQQDPTLALQHQMTIIECLDHPDPIIKREKMLDFLRQSKDEHTTIDLVGKTMNTVFSLGGDEMQPEVPNNFLRLLAEGFDSADEDMQLKLYAVDSYLSLLQTDTSHLPQRFLQVISWVLGEFSFLRAGLEPSVVLERLAGLLEQDGVTMETRSWVLLAMCKLCGGAACVGVAGKVAGRYASSLSTTIRQQALELQVLSQDEALRARVLPQNTSWDGLEVDSSLSFMDGFVSDALAQGAAPYKPPHQRQEELSQEKVLNFEPYGLSLPVSLSTCSLTDRQSPTGLSLSSSLSGNSTEPLQKGGSLKMEGVRRVWGKEGYIPQKEAVEEAPVVPSLIAPVPSHQQGGAECTPTDDPGPELEQENDKRQLASSLFVGLGPLNEPCLMGKPDVAPQRFRRKGRAQESVGGSDRLSNSSYSSHSTVDSLLDSIPSTLGEEPNTKPNPIGPIGERPITVRPVGEGLTSSTLGEGLTAVGPLGEGPHKDVDLLEEGPASVRSKGEGPTTAYVEEEPNTIDLRGEEPTPIGPLGHRHVESQPACPPQSELEDMPGSRAETEVEPPESSDKPVEPSPVQTDKQTNSSLPAELEGLPHSELLSLASDRSLSLSACKVYREDVLELILFIRNTGTSPLLDLSLQLNSENLKVSDGPNRTIQSLSDHGVMTSQRSVVMETPLVQATVGGTLTYHAQSGSANELRFSLGFTLTDFIRPLPLRTEDYGKLWLSISHDVKQNLQLLRDEDNPLLATLNVLKEKLHLHLVDIIVWLRSPVSDLPDCLLYHCQRALQER